MPVRAFDTNVVVRLLTTDDKAQAATAEALLHEPFLLLPSVLIETVGVLRTRYGYTRQTLSAKLNALLGLDMAVIVSPDAVEWAMLRHDEGADFADMLHAALAAEHDADSFATFDNRIKDRHLEGLPVRLERLA